MYLKECILSLYVKFFKTSLESFQNKDSFCQGSCFLNDSLLQNQDLLSVIQNNIDSLDVLLNELNGFFNFVLISDNCLYAGVDKIRSQPLFYAVCGDDFYISTKAEWIRETLGLKQLDEIAEKEFLCTGYVTGRDTLFSEIKQIQAGEYIKVKLQKQIPSDVSVECIRYYRFLHIEPHTADSKEFYFSNLNIAMNSSIERLIKFANGRQIVIPLSSGRDSRLIAMKLKEYNYPDVICFSYGKPNNFEAVTSQKVSTALGFPWYFIEYTPELEDLIFNSTEGMNYSAFAGNCVSLPHTQDLCAVRELKNRKLIKPDAVFCPGHSGDFVAGSHIPDHAEEMKVSENVLLQLISVFHYCLSSLSLKERHFVNNWRNRIKNSCEYENIDTGVDLANYFEKWDWQERQAKFIVNSLRVYEFYGFSWWIPFWDSEFMYFWEKLPLQYRLYKTLYDEYVDGLTAKYNISIQSEKKHQNKLKKKIKHILISLGMFGCLKNIRTISLEKQLAKGTNASTRYRNIIDDIPANIRYLNGIDCLVYIKNIKKALLLNI